MNCKIFFLVATQKRERLNSYDGNLIRNGEVGYLASYSPRSWMECNLITNNITGIKFEYLCSNTHIGANSLSHNTEVGLAMHEQNMLGPQIHKGLDWSDESATFDGTYQGIIVNEARTINHFRIHPQNAASGGMDLMIPAGFSPSDWIEINADVLDPSCRELPEPISTPIYQYSAGILDPFSNTGDSKAETFWFMQRFALLEYLTYNLDALNESADLFNFYSDNIESSLGELLSATDMVQNFGAQQYLTENQQSERQVLLSAMEQINLSIFEKTKESIQALNMEDMVAFEALTIDLISLETERNEFSEALIELEANFDILKFQKLAEIESMNAAINIPYLAAKNIQCINASKLWLLQSEETNFSTLPSNLKLKLEVIANQCVDEGGPAVLMARIWVKDWGVTIEETVCERSSEFDNSVYAENAFQLFPNPTTGEVKITSQALFGTHDSETIRCTVYDIMGRLVLTKEFSKKLGFINPDLSALPKGTYQVNVQDAHWSKAFSVIKH